MISALTREYAERTSESNTSLGIKKLNNRKGQIDSETYQSFVSESFRFGFWIWTNFIALLRFSASFCAVFCFVIFNLNYN